MTGRVIVLGSINVDLIASVDRLPEAGETVTGSGLLTQLGGKGANQAVSAARAGAISMMFGAIGEDDAGAMVLVALTGHGVGTDGVLQHSGPTGHALVVTSPRNNQIVVVAGANAAINGDLVNDIEVGRGDICLTQMETPPEVASAFFRKARSSGGVTMLNAAPASNAALPLLPLTDVLIVNESELSLLAETPIADGCGEGVIAAAVVNSVLAEVETVLVTLGAAGVAIVRNGRVSRVKGRQVEVVDTTGAGDCFCGYVATGLARGDALEKVVAEANVAASIAVQSLGAASAMPLRSKVLSAMAAVQQGVC